MNLHNNTNIMIIVVIVVVVVVVSRYIKSTTNFVRIQLLYNRPFKALKISFTPLKAKFRHRAFTAPNSIPFGAVPGTVKARLRFRHCTQLI